MRGFEVSPRLGVYLVAFGLHAIAHHGIVELRTLVWTLVWRRLEG